MYGLVYRINVQKNDKVIVQQCWIKEWLKKNYGLSNVVVCKPIVPIEKDVLSDSIVRKKLKTFVFPAYPRNFKNFEIICKASKILINRGVKNFKIVFTINGSENAYSKELYNRYSNVNQIEWWGLISRNEVYKLYNKADVLIFPSKIETWGLPITEFANTKKAMLVADLPYAHETVGEYEKVNFFDVNNPIELANLMDMEICNENKYQGNKNIGYKYINGWIKLFESIL